MTEDFALLGSGKLRKYSHRSVNSESRGDNRLGLGRTKQSVNEAQQLSEM